MGFVYALYMIDRIFHNSFSHQTSSFSKAFCLAGLDKLDTIDMVYNSKYQVIQLEKGNT